MGEGGHRDWIHPFLYTQNTEVMVLVKAALSGNILFKGTKSAMAGLPKATQ